jgi:methylglyoxal synthase
MPNTLALLAHPQQVSDLVDWLYKNQRLLQHFRIQTSPDIADIIEKSWGVTDLQLTRLLPPDQGGEIALASQILAGKLPGYCFL